MAPTRISVALRESISDRAEGQCEYCLFPQDASFLPFELEHIISEKHGGQTSPENLALACPFCNRFKGTDLGSIDPTTGQLTPFFNPRTQRWSDHFRFDGVKILPLTAEGRVTVSILQFNHPDRLAERERLFASRKFVIPSPPND
ncbi:MAG: HNH endonuclease [Chloroflexota bacterium]